MNVENDLEVPTQLIAMYGGDKPAVIRIAEAICRLEGVGYELAGTGQGSIVNKLMVIVADLENITKNANFD